MAATDAVRRPPIVWPWVLGLLLLALLVWALMEWFAQSRGPERSPDGAAHERTSAAPPRIGTAMATEGTRMGGACFAPDGSVG